MNSIAHQLPRGESLIIKYLQDNGSEFTRPQKYIAKAIGYSRPVTNIFIKRLEKKGLLIVEQRIGDDARLKVITLAKGVQANG